MNLVWRMPSPPNTSAHRCLSSWVLVSWVCSTLKSWSTHLCIKIAGCPTRRVYVSFFFHLQEATASLWITDLKLRSSNLLAILPYYQGDPKSHSWGVGSRSKALCKWGSSKQCYWETKCQREVAVFWGWLWGWEVERRRMQLMIP